MTAVKTALDLLIETVNDLHAGIRAEQQKQAKKSRKQRDRLVYTLIAAGPGQVRPLYEKLVKELPRAKPLLDEWLRLKLRETSRVRKVRSGILRKSPR